MTKEEYKKTYIRMMDSLRVNTQYIGSDTCTGVLCEKCPFKNIVGVDRCDLSNAFEAIEIVEKWGKEHPIMTMKDKYKEVFGCEPKKENGQYFCPSLFGITKSESCAKKDCWACARKFWESEEYKAPKGE